MPWVLLCAAVTGVVTLGGVRWLETGWWRRPGETAELLAHRHVVLPVLAAGCTLLVGTALVRAGHAWALPAFGVLVVAGVLLAAVDLAVHRLPDPLTLGALPPVLALLALASWREGRWPAMEWAGWGALVSLLVLLVLALGGLGLGDVKLGILLGTALGWFGLPVVLVGLAAGFVLGGLWAVALLVSRRASRGSHLAYGPWLLTGALLAVATAG